MNSQRVSVASAGIKGVHYDCPVSSSCPSNSFPFLPFPNFSCCYLSCLSFHPHVLSLFFEFFPILLLLLHLSFFPPPSTTPSSSCPLFILSFLLSSYASSHLSSLCLFSFPALVFLCLLPSLISMPSFFLLFLLPFIFPVFYPLPFSVLSFLSCLLPCTLFLPSHFFSFIL